MSHAPPEPEIERLLRELSSPEAKRRESTARGIARSGAADERIVGALGRLAARDPVPYVREAALSALTVLTSRSAEHPAIILDNQAHLEYLLAWLDQHEELLGPALHARLHGMALQELESARAAQTSGEREALVPTTHPIAKIAPPAAREGGRELALIQACLDGIDVWGKANVISPATARKWHHYFAPRMARLKSELKDGATWDKPIPELDILNYLQRCLIEWAEVESVPLPVSESLRNLLNKRRDALSAAAPLAAGSIEQPVPAAPIPTPAPREPIPPPKPAALPIDWEQAWQRAWGLVVSGALLRGLLYLGAFMIVVSAAVLVVVYWSAIPKIFQLGFAVALPLSFYLAGFILRARLKIPVAGGAFTAIGALLVAVDFAAVYQLGGLAGLVDINVYWLAASFLCTLAYIVTAWRMRTEFYGYITHLAVSSSVLAFTRVLQLPLEWGIAAVTASAIGGVEAAARLGRGPARYGDLATAARRLPQILIPATLAFVIFGMVPLAQMATFAFAALGFALLVWRLPAQAPRSRWTSILSHAAVWSSVGAVAYALWATPLPDEWYAAAVAVLAPCYVLIARGMGRQTRLDSPARPAFLTALNSAGIVLVAIAIAAGFLTVLTNLWASVLALTLSAAVLTAYAYLFRRSVLVLSASALVVAPFSFALARLLIDSHVAQWGAWVMSGWAVLALTYLGIALLFRAPKYGAWLNLVAHLLAPAASVGLLINYAATSRGWVAGSTLVALTGIILVYVASAVIHDREHPALSQYLRAWLPRAVERAIFLYPVGILAPVWLSIAWYATVLDQRWLGAALAALALAYVGAGQALVKRRKEYRLPPHMYAYPLALAGVLVAGGNLQALTVALYLVVATLAALAIVYRRIWETSLAAVLFLWPVELSLELSPLPAHAYSLVYALLASLGYVPLGLVLARAGRKFALPLYIVGYALSAVAVIASLAGRFGLYSINVPWVGVVVPLIVAGLLVFSASRFKRAGFARAAAGVLPIAFGQTLTLLHVLPEYEAAAWVGLAFAYMLIDRFADRAAPKRFDVHLFQWPLRAGAAALGTLGLLLTAFDTTSAFIGTPGVSYLPLILAQGLAVVLTALAAWLYRNRWVLYLEPAIAFFPVTLFFIGYGAQIIARPFAAAEFALVWAGLGMVHLLAGALLDERPVRYSHALYLGGYALSGLALLWSWLDRLSNIYTLGVVILAAVASHLLVHFGRHHSFDDFIRLTRLKPDTSVWRAARSVFLFFAVYALPVWLVQLLIYLNVPLAWRGVALALAAPVYIASGLVLRRFKSEYTWPLYSAGYVLSAIGAMVTFDNEALAIYVLALDAVVYAASAVIFRQAYWLYLSNALVPVIALLVLHYDQVLTAPWVSGIFMGLAFAYFAVGRVFTAKTPFALPFLVPSYFLSAAALAVASGDRLLALEIYPAGVVLYALSAWVLRESLFLYPAAWLVAVPYYLGMTLTALPPEWYGLGWLPLIIAYIVIARLVFEARGRTGISPTHPAIPFYILAYGLSVSMVISSANNAMTLTLASTAAAILYFGSAALFRRAVWFYPGLVSAHLAFAALLTTFPSDRPWYYLSVPFLGMTWLVALVGLAFGRFAPRRDRSATPVPTRAGAERLRALVPTSKSPWLDALTNWSWAQPFIAIATLDVILWQIVALNGLGTAIILASGNLLLLALFATLWQDSPLAYGAVVFLLIGLGNRFEQIDMPFAEGMAWIGAAGFGMYLLARVSEQTVLRAKRARWLAVWFPVLTKAAIVLTTLAAVATIPTVVTHMTASAAGLGFAGALYLAIAYRRRNYGLGYLGMALLEVAWALALFDRQIAEPQVYAIPAGLYLVGVGFLERRHSSISPLMERGQRGVPIPARKTFATFVESFGLVVLLLTSFLQSLNGAEGFPYFLLLMAQALLTVWWGAARRIKVPFFIGLGASALNVVAQVLVLVNVYDVNRFIAIFVVGLLLVTIAVFVERQRALIIAKAQQWLEVLEAWA